MSNGNDPKKIRRHLHLLPSLGQHPPAAVNRPAKSQ